MIIFTILLIDKDLRNGFKNKHVIKFDLLWGGVRGSWTDEQYSNISIHDTIIEHHHDSYN